MQTGFFVLCSGLEKTLWLRPFLYLHIQRGKDPKTCNKRVKESVFFFFFWWLQMAFIAVCYMFVDLFALQHIADRQGEYRASFAHQSFEPHFRCSSLET